MKKVIIIFIAAIAIFSSCRKCIECTESSTKLSQTYCGGPAEIKAFETTLKEEGSAYGQSWNCVNK